MKFDRQVNYNFLEYYNIKLTCAEMKMFTNDTYINRFKLYLNNTRILINYIFFLCSPI